VGALTRPGGATLRSLAKHTFAAIRLYTHMFQVCYRMRLEIGAGFCEGEKHS
jgi:hypothetical protein